VNSSWPLVTLDEVLRPVTRPESVDPEKTYKILGAHWYAKGLYVKDTLTGVEIRADKVYKVEAGDFVYNRLFAWKGSFAVATKEDKGCYVSNEFPCFAVRQDKADPIYLWRYFSRSSVWDEALGLSSGGTPTSRNRLKEEKFLALKVPLPPLPEQRRIVARIEELAAKINEARSLRQLAIEGAKALIVSAGRSLFGETPQANWIPLSRLVAEIENGKSPQCESRPATGEEWGVLKVGAVSFGSFDDRENKALPLGLKFDPRHEVRSGDFLMSRANTTELVGACAIVDRTRPRLLLSDKTFRFQFRCNAEFSPHWLDHAMKSPALREQIERGASGTSPTMKNISKEKVLKLLLPPRSFPEQCRIVAELNALYAQVDALKKLQADTAAELDALLPSILDKAFRGQV
jgi:type I restriction enzyme, S subunit